FEPAVRPAFVDDLEHGDALALQRLRVERRIGGGRMAQRGLRGRDLVEPAAPGASAADLKFLHHLRRTHSETSNRKAARGSFDWLVPLCFRSPYASALQRTTNVGSGALAIARHQKRVERARSLALRTFRPARLGALVPGEDVEMQPGLGSAHEAAQ